MANAPVDYADVLELLRSRGLRMTPQRRWPFDEAGVDLDFLTAPHPTGPQPVSPTPRRPAGALAEARRSRWA